MVFSSGFIEHFSEPKRVLERIIQLSSPNGGVVVTIIPSMTGINMWISRTFRPKVAAVHFPITLQELVNYHESFGLKTDYCNYAGCLTLLPPMSKSRFAQQLEYYP
jgi:hypothetical protein